MQRSNAWMAALGLVIGLQAITIGYLLQSPQHSGSKAAPVARVAPAKIEAIANTKLKQITLTAKAAERLGIKTAAVTEEVLAAPRTIAGPTAVPAPTRKVVPYGSLLYDSDGSTWLYISPTALTYVRHPIKVEFIVGDKAALLEGPAVATVVVTEGAVQLFGAEFKVGH